MTGNWSCPYCNRAQTVTSGQTSTRKVVFDLASHKYGDLGANLVAFACANTDCAEVTVGAVLMSGAAYGHFGQRSFSGDTTVISSHRLRPDSLSKPQPSYIPAALREDYQEACRIRDLSPKASATLSRRCIQGMIRDFAKISRNTLFAEIKALSELLEADKAPPGVSAETVEAIDHVRSIGNIGAHMERNIDQIVPVDAGEAQALIELTELLFEEWYVARQTRSEKLQRVKRIAEDKAAIKVFGPAPGTPEG